MKESSQNLIYVKFLRKEVDFITEPGRLLVICLLFFTLHNVAL